MFDTLPGGWNHGAVTGDSLALIAGVLVKGKTLIHRREKLGETKEIKLGAIFHIYSAGRKMLHIAFCILTLCLIWYSKREPEHCLVGL